MPPWLKISIRIVAIIVGLVFILWMGLAAYVYSNRVRLLQSITTQLNEGINGNLSIEGMEPALLKGFPGISVSLKNVLLRDSLWAVHKHDLINAKTVFVSVDVFSMLVGSTRIRNLSINDGKIYLYTDSSGISNVNLFRKSTSKDLNKKEGFREKINQVNLNHVQLTIDNKAKNKFFNFAVDKLHGEVKYAGSGWNGRLKMAALVRNFEFNSLKGSFMKGKIINADLKVNYSHIKHQLTIPEQNITIGDDGFEVGGNFMFSETSSDFELTVHAPNILFKNAANLLTPPISSKLNEYVLVEPIDAKAVIHGRLKGGGEPLINVLMVVKDNTLSIAKETIKDCNFTGRFTNEFVKGNGLVDSNSAISLHNLEGKLYDIPFKSDSIQILNLNYPVFTGLFKADFPLSKLNKVAGENFHFNAGSATLNLLFKAPYSQNAKGLRYIFGTVKVNGASATYVPRNLLFKNASVTFNFKGRDLFLDNMKVQTNNSALQMQASLLDFSNLYYSDPAKLVVDWNIQSPQINLNEFLGFLGKRKEAETKSTTSFSKKIDELLDQANMHLRLSIGKLMFKNFMATNVKSDIVLKKAGISIKNLSLNQGGGSLHVDGEIDQSGSNNRFNILTKINNVDVQKLFYAFENFGQNGITDANLRGSFFGSTNISGSIRDNGQIVPRSFHGSVDFDIRNGSLLNFEPMRKIGALAFPNRDFKNIQFLSLKNTLAIQGNKITIPPMVIESSVLNVFLGGVYSLTTGTNIAIKIPLRNPKKDVMVASESLKSENALKGIVINLRAIDGEDGKIKFKLGKKAPEGYE